MASENYRPILLELRKLNNPKRNWGKPILIFATTLALFAMTGWVRYNDPVFLGIIVGVLFFHELGHFVAMRLFGYRNVRIFFIPLFGAAVSGRCFQPSGWKRAVVSLMGPLPGIIVGTMLFAAPLWGHPPHWFGRMALVLLSLNLFNLLPLLPFDGGHYLNAILFCRNRWLEGAFRLITGILIGLLAWKLNSIPLEVITVMMLLFIGVSFRYASIASRLRDHLPKPNTGSDEIPEQAAVAIIDEVRAKFPQLKTDAKIAAAVQNIYENATTRSPSWLVSVGLLIIYPLAFLCPLAPWAFEAWRNPARIHEWRDQLIRTRDARHKQAAKPPEVSIEINPVERHISSLGPLKSV